MRTLLNESFPPNCMAEPMFSASEPARIFSQSAVLGKLDDLVEVGVGETVMAAPSASHDALERGVAFKQTEEGAVSP